MTQTVLVMNLILQRDKIAGWEAMIIPTIATFWLFFQKHMLAGFCGYYVTFIYVGKSGYEDQTPYLIDLCKSKAYEQLLVVAQDAALPQNPEAEEEQEGMIVSFMTKWLPTGLEYMNAVVNE